MTAYKYSKLQTPFCDYILVADSSGLVHTHLLTGEGKRRFVINTDWERDDRYFEIHHRQINEYFSGKRTKFDLPIHIQGTPFQLMVWHALQTIPFGEVRSYKQIAEQIGKHKAARAVGMAISKNPLPLIVPCHRVIGADGRLTGFAHGLRVKEKLLLFESRKLTS